MIRGEVIPATYSDAELGISPITSTLSVIRPDGSTQSISSGITVSTTDPATGAITVTADAVQFPITGEYTLTWNFVNNADTAIRSQTRFVWWTDIANVIRSPQLLNLKAKDLSTLYIEHEYAHIVKGLYRAFPSLPAYDAMTLLDRINFEQGAAFLTAVALRSRVPKTVATGEIISWKIQQTEYVFSNPKLLHPVDILAEWTNNGMSLLQNVTGIASTYVARKTGFFMFEVTGPTRLRRQYSRDTLFATVASLLSDSYQYYGNPAISGINAVIGEGVLEGGN